MAKQKHKLQPKPAVPCSESHRQSTLNYGTSCPCDVLKLVYRFLPLSHAVRDVCKLWRQAFDLKIWSVAPVAFSSEVTMTNDHTSMQRKGLLHVRALMANVDLRNFVTRSKEFVLKEIIANEQHAYDLHFYDQVDSLTQRMTFVSPGGYTYVVHNGQWFSLDIAFQPGNSKGRCVTQWVSPKEKWCFSAELSELEGEIRAQIGSLFENLDLRPISGLIVDPDLREMFQTLQVPNAAWFYLHLKSLRATSDVWVVHEFKSDKTCIPLRMMLPCATPLTFVHTLRFELPQTCTFEAFNDLKHLQDLLLKWPCTTMEAKWSWSSFVFGDALKRLTLIGFTNLPYSRLQFPRTFPGLERLTILQSRFTTTKSSFDLTSRSLRRIDLIECPALPDIKTQTRCDGWLYFHDTYGLPLEDYRQKKSQFAISRLDHILL